MKITKVFKMVFKNVNFGKTHNLFFKNGILWDAFYKNLETKGRKKTLAGHT